MTDIVLRLRSFMSPLPRAAADEIERLEGEVFVLRQALYDETEGITATIRADEMERMRTTLKALSDDPKTPRWVQLLASEAVPKCKNCKDPIWDGHSAFCGMCREMGCTLPRAIGKQ